MPRTEFITESTIPTIASFLYFRLFSIFSEEEKPKVAMDVINPMGGKNQVIRFEYAIPLIKELFILVLFKYQPGKNNPINTGISIMKKTNGPKTFTIK